MRVLRSPAHQAVPTAGLLEILDGNVRSNRRCTLDNSRRYLRLEEGIEVTLGRRDSASTPCMFPAPTGERMKSLVKNPVHSLSGMNRREQAQFRRCD
eukprot:m.194221 g.194221  ORF g.194221 m.194221 type:complete len:97 (-) comp15201_c0_seq1:731-1021(-)